MVLVASGLMNLVAELLLKNVFSKPNENVTKSASGLPPGKMSGIGYSYYLNENYKNEPSLHNFLRKKVAKDISFSEAHKFCDTLEKETIPAIISRKALSCRDDRTLYEVIRKEEADWVEETFLRLRDNFKKNKYYTFPLYRFSGDEFRGSNFSILATHSLSNKLQRAITEYPYYSKIERWLTIPARSTERACERMEAICASFSLSLSNPQRYQFTMALEVSGHVDEEGCFHSTPSRVLPSLSTDIKIDAADHNWLKQLDKNIGDEHISSKHLQALRFFFFSWFAASQERFALNCMALDALVPSKIKDMQRKCEWIRNSSSVAIDINSVELLFKKIRSSIIHGSSASLPLCPEYPTFISLYRVEALTALDALTADVLKKQIFPSLMTTRVSELDRDPEIKAAAERIFGADNLEKIRLRSDPLKSLSKGHPSTWEKDVKSPGLIEKFITLMKAKGA